MSTNNGSEIHRLKEFDHYDRDKLEKLYKLCKPLIRNLSKSIDPRRFNVSNDIIQSYFWDKFLHVFYKYQDKYDDERLKASILTSLQIFKNKLLRNAYTKQAEFNQDLTSFEVLFDNNKEWLDDSDETSMKEDLSIKFNQYMKSKLTSDEYLLFRTELNPPPFFDKLIAESHGKLSILHLIDFFGLPRDRRSHNMLTQMRNNIKSVLKEASTDFKR